MVYDYEEFKKQVFALTKIDLNAYKERQMKRRIDSLIAKHKVVGYEPYVKLLKEDHIMFEEFVNYLTINVSEFYRNPDQWKILENKVFPYLFQHFGKNITIWSAACSTGDEPYSLAMLLSKFIPMRQIHIIATDIDKQVLAKAKTGLYAEKSLKELPGEFRNRFFTKIGSSYQISDEVKACVEFRQHNLLKDEYLNSCDMIICRNVLIYFTEEAKLNIYKKFNKSLKKDGILFVGSTEQIIQPQFIGFNSFESFFYQKQ